MNAMHDRSRLTGFLLAAGATLLMSSVGARAETWCLRQFGSDSQVCVFSSAGQCTSAAAIGGGVCERERLGRASAAKPCKPSREVGAARSSPRAASAC
jgi:hypothetical protein